MNLVENLQKHVPLSGALEQVVRKYGADFLSTYGAATIAAVGVATISTGIGPYLAAGAALALVSIVNKLGHDCREIELLKTYDNQIASALEDPAHPGKTRDPASLTTDDLRDFIAGRNVIGQCKNNILASEVDANDRRMHINIVLHCLGGVLFGAAAFGIGALSKFLPGIPPITGTLGAGAGALLLFQQIDRVVTDIGRTLMVANPSSAHERIMGLEGQLYGGHQVSRLQVFDVMVDGDPQLQQTIREANHGIGFHHLYLDDRIAAMESFGVPRGLDAMTASLNTGKIEAEDLVLAVCDLPMAQRHAALSRLHGKRFIPQTGTAGTDEPSLSLNWAAVAAGVPASAPAAAAPAGDPTVASTYFQDRLSRENDLAMSVPPSQSVH